MYTSTPATTANRPYVVDPAKEQYSGLASR